MTYDGGDIKGVHRCVIGSFAAPSVPVLLQKTSSTASLSLANRGHFSFATEHLAVNDQKTGLYRLSLLGFRLVPALRLELRTSSSTN
jgi:hypothetical protein